MQLETGAVVTGKVTGITKYGAFVELEDRKTGMVHISEVASVYVKEISDYLSVGQEVKVKVLDIASDGKIALSIKKVEDERKQKAYAQRRESPSADRSPSWQPSKAASEPKSFDDMLSKFISSSEEKLSSFDRGERRSSRRSSGSRNRNDYYDD